MDEFKKMKDFFELRSKILKYCLVEINIKDETIYQKDNLLLIVKHLLDALDEKEKTITKIRFALKAFIDQLEPSEYNAHKTKEMLKMDIFGDFYFYGVDLNKFLKGEF